jgi:FecR-like protein
VVHAGKSAGAVWMGRATGPRRLQLAVRVVGLGFVLAIVLGVVSMFGTQRALGAATTITIISGDTRVRHGTGAFAPANDGEVLTAGDSVRTGDGARAVLTYFEGSTVTLEPNTELTITDASTLTDGSTIVVMQQTLGRTWHVVTKLVTGSSKYEVKTPASTASVRGTTFTVDVAVEDAVPVATVTTTEGTVVHSAPDPETPSRQVSVRVAAGTAAKIKKGERPLPAGLAPEPERKVTVEIGAGNSLIVDPLGRANGFTRDGKRVIQTPGAQVKMEGDRIVVVLPDLPGGDLVTRVDEDKHHERGGGVDINVKTTVEERGKAPLRLEHTVTVGSAGSVTTGKKTDDAPKASDAKKTADARKVAPKVQDLPKAPRLMPSLPAVPKRADQAPTSSENKSKNDNGADRGGSSRSSGSDAMTKDKGK